MQTAFKFYLQIKLKISLLILFQVRYFAGLQNQLV